MPAGQTNHFISLAYFDSCYCVACLWLSNCFRVCYTLTISEAELNLVYAVECTRQPQLGWLVWLIINCNSVLLPIQHLKRVCCSAKLDITVPKLEIFNMLIRIEIEWACLFDFKSALEEAVYFTRVSSASIHTINFNTCKLFRVERVFSKNVFCLFGPLHLRYSGSLFSSRTYGKRCAVKFIESGVVRIHSEAPPLNFAFIANLKTFVVGNSEHLSIVRL